MSLKTLDDLWLDGQLMTKTDALLYVADLAKRDAGGDARGGHDHQAMPTFSSGSVPQSSFTAAGLS